MPRSITLLDTGWKPVPLFLKPASLFRKPMLFGLCLSLTGCLVQRVDPKATPTTTVDPQLASSDYWFNRPAVARVESRDFDALWDACRRTIIDSSFVIDRTDYRTGLMTTRPLTSKQFFEFWKHDVVDPKSQLESDAATRRRVVHFQIRKARDGGGYVCEPKVVVEHYAMPERQITSVSQYQDVFSTRKPLEEEQTDEGAPVRPDYWYAERRDPALERALADKLRDRLHDAAVAQR